MTEIGVMHVLPGGPILGPPARFEARIVHAQICDTYAEFRQTDKSYRVLRDADAIACHSSCAVAW